MDKLHLCQEELKLTHATKSRIDTQVGFVSKFWKKDVRYFTRPVDVLKDIQLKTLDRTFQWLIKIRNGYLFALEKHLSRISIPLNWRKVKWSEGSTSRRILSVINVLRGASVGSEAPIRLLCRILRISNTANKQNYSPKYSLD